MRAIGARPAFTRAILDSATADPRRAPNGVISGIRCGGSPPKRLASLLNVTRSSRIPWTAPSSSALTGASTQSAQTSALTVSRPRLGGVSMTTSSYSAMTGCAHVVQEPFASELADEAHLGAGAAGHHVYKLTPSERASSQNCC